MTQATATAPLVYTSKVISQDVIDAAIEEGQLLTIQELYDSLEELIKIEYSEELHTEICILGHLFNPQVVVKIGEMNNE